MKPTPVQVSQLHSFLQVLHGAKLRQFQQMANTFTQFLQGLPRFNIVDTTPQQPHVGRVIVDGVLQQGKDYEKVVRHAVECVTKFGEAATLSGFTALLSKEPLKNVLGNFSKENTKRDLFNTTDFFIHKQLDTFDDLHQWMKPEGNRDIFAKAGKLGPFFRPADKTADYFRKLLGHWDAIAVDTGQRKLLAQANLVPFYSTIVAYKEKRTILQLTALNLDSRPIDLDSSIYKYYVDTNKMKGTAQQPQNLPKSGGKYCHNCGHRLFDLDTFCTKCGTKQH